jgi:hypothetical protein
MWDEAIKSCQSAWDVSVAAAQREKLSANHHDFHSLHWLVEMNFELGHRKQADAALEQFRAAIRAGLGRQHRAVYATQVSSYAMRTGQWSRVDELLSVLDATPRDEVAPPPGPPGAVRAGTEPAHCAAMPATAPALFEEVAVLETRARAAAMQKDLPATKKYLAELAATREKLRPFLASTQPATLLAATAKAAERRGKILLAYASGDDLGVLAGLRESARERELDANGENNPSGFQVNEELGDTLMRLGRFKEAAAEYATALQHQPNRARSLLGAARAAAKLGDKATASQRYAELHALWRTADPETDGLAEVRAAAN